MGAPCAQHPSACFSSIIRRGSSRQHTIREGSPIETPGARQGQSRSAAQWRWRFRSGQYIPLHSSQRWQNGQGKIDRGFAHELQKLTQWICLPPSEAFTAIANAGFDADYVDDDEWKGISSFVIGSVLWSLYSFLTSPDDYWETICTAVVVGGDVDTTAAMAGAISGAHLGISAIPSAFVVSSDRQRHMGTHRAC